MRNNSLLAIMDLITDDPPLLFKNFTKITDENKNELPWNEIQIMYESEVKAHKIMGIILNGVITNQKPRFLFSLRICNQMIKDSGIASIKSISGDTYKKLLGQLTDDRTKFMKCLDRTDQNKGRLGKAWTYELTFEPALNYLKN